jgi:hypothetical protein
MTMNYFLESSHICGYELYTLPGVKFTLRGPQWPLEAPTPSISFLGAAQTFGAFCKYPYANLLGEMCSARVFNFGRGGAGAGFYNEHQTIIDYVNKTDCCVVQVMSARSSIENSYMESPWKLAGVRFKKGPLAGQAMMGHIAFPKLWEIVPQDEFYEIVEETRNGFVDQMTKLAELIKVPKILLYVGRNPPLPDIPLADQPKLNDLFGIHPHMVTRRMVERISAHYDATVFAIGDEGFDKPLVNRFTGETVSIKRSETYTVRKHDAYISPALHVRAALELYRPVNDILSSH